MTGTPTYSKGQGSSDRGTAIDLVQSYQDGFVLQGRLELLLAEQIMDGIQMEAKGSVEDVV